MELRKRLEKFEDILQILTDNSGMDLHIPNWGAEDDYRLGSVSREKIYRLEIVSVDEVTS